MSLDWGVISNIESSLKDFLVSQANTDNITVDIDVADEYSNDWTLPRIVIDSDSKQKPRLEIGTNKRQNSYLIIIDIHARTNIERINLADWIETTINDGFDYYDYSSNPSNRDVPIKSQTAYVNFDYVTSQKVRLGDNVNDYDKWRYRISIQAWISGACNI